VSADLPLAFLQPWALLLLPLALLPLLPRRHDTLVYPHLGWLPRDRAVKRSAGPCACWPSPPCSPWCSPRAAGPPEAFVPRIGRGAEIVLLIDRSRSMDERMLPADWRTIDPLNLRYQAARAASARARPRATCSRASSASAPTTASR
jgi:mxaC protein